MATLRLATSPGLRAATTSPLTSQLWSSAAAVNASTTSATTTIPSATVASVAAATASSTVTTTKTIIPPPPSVLAHARKKHVEPQDRYFNPSNATLSTTGGRPGKEPGDENNANLGKTLRILQDHLPRVLQAPLPQEILAPNISLHLFPTTHPHLPTVSGRVAYTAALWTSPIAWNRMPLVGNVRLSIVSERVTKQPLHFAPLHPGAVPEQLVVRWCASGKKSGGGVGGAAGSPSSGAATSEGGGAKTEDGGDNAFTGLFVFQFDAEGRILSHTIETVQEGGDWEKGVGAKVVGLTDWLLGGMRRQGENPSPAFEALDKGKQ
ncbi:hypothetical protein BDP55DRAFT_554596 [Colletotrichum godetiae]|uniref:Uncharacterized protein n=1 Tax=Colletotrichum godetiae TaxID=1209918 RepID=A0AAJ0AL03_9PEZI|nr:uncharacterized protein BDP55DRAFT_554596 [Colletotrichum godetiae]KAK1674353.1 hypothetical protein BDP55DRAFT_554596 [Colletotrichum godetiae]